MNLQQLLKIAEEKQNFNTINDYAAFCQKYLEYIYNGLQAVIVSQNEHKYCFFQYKEDGSFSITRPVNRDLMLSAEVFEAE